MLPARHSSKGSFPGYQPPNYLYYPTHSLPNGTRDWTRVRLLQACERLAIPNNLWPQFKSIRLGDATNVTPVPAFVPPPFNYLSESIVEWRSAAEKSFREHCDKFAEAMRAYLRRKVAQGVLTKIKQPKGHIPTDLRYEWAARRYCLRERYKAIGGPNYSDDVVRQVVHRILKDAQLHTT